MKLRPATMFSVLALVAACDGSTKPDPATTPTTPTDAPTTTTTSTPVVTLADLATPLCAPGALQGTLPPGTGTLDATLTLDGRPTDVVLEPGPDGAFEIDPALLPLGDLCTPAQAPCTLDARLTGVLDGQSVSDDATLTLTDEGVLTAFPDADGDGYGAEGAASERVCDDDGYADQQGDCNDDPDLDPNAAAVFPGADELCDGFDNDCDGGIDDDDPEGAADGLATFPDGDGDGAFVDQAAIACAPPGTEGVDYVLAAPAAGEEDCDDNDAALNRLDLDVDGWSTCSGECDDANPAARPDATELVGSGIDEDCDGTSACFEDLDQDGYGSTTVVLGASPVGPGACDDPPLGLADDATDCLDSDAQAYPGGTEVTGDDVDQDCDAVYACFVDVDGDGYGTPLTAGFATPCGVAAGASAFDSDCDDDVADGAQRSPGNPEVVGNTVDEDCSLSYACYVDADDDGFAALGAAVIDGLEPCDLLPGGGGAATPATLGVDIDCDDASTAFAPGRDDATVGDPDTDCDGLVTCYLDADDDNYGVATTADSSVAPGGPSNCDEAPNVASNTADCLDTDGTQYPGAPEVACDGIEQDCSFFGRPDARVAILADPSAGFSPDDVTFDGSAAQDQLTAALAAALAGDTVRLCGDETYFGPFHMNRPITLEGEGAAFRGQYPAPQPADCVGTGEESVLTVSSPGTTTVKDLTIFGGCADGKGGGLLVEGISYVEATNLVLFENAADEGGGVAVKDTATLAWSGGELTNNHAVDGGGAWVFYDATLLIGGGVSTFDLSGNTASSLGGGVVGYGTVEFVNTQLSDNTAALGGGIYSRGAADFLDTTVSDNAASATGGGVYSTETVTFVGSTVSGNTSNTGGGILAYGTVAFVDSTLTDNTAVLGGGAYLQASATVDFLSSTLSNNAATDEGGAIYSLGAAVFDEVTLSNNTAASGNTIHLTGESANFTYTIAPGGNGDATPNIHCDTFGNEYSTTDTYASCDAETCTP